MTGPRVPACAVARDKPWWAYGGLRTARQAALGILLLTSAGVAGAGRAVSVEIDHLLRYIGGSGCGFVRNSVVHGSEEAQQHLRRKMAQAPARLPTAEAFIRHIASRSSFSGEAYRVRCQGTEYTAEQWLLDELARMRRAAVG